MRRFAFTVRLKPGSLRAVRAILRQGPPFDLEYRLGSAHEAFKRDIVSAASPMGQALMGVVPGAVVSVDLPDGNVRSVRLVAVETGAAGIAG
jgi:hypothetical protein